MNAGARSGTSARHGTRPGATRTRSSSGRGGAHTDSARSIDGGTHPGEPGASARAQRLLSIGEAAARVGVSDRALRYYQELGLLTPCERTPGGMRRYSEEDLARVRHIRELQELLGLNLDEVHTVLRSEDQIAALRQHCRQAPAGSARRDELVTQTLALQHELREAVEAKLAGLTEFLADLDAAIAKVRSATRAEDPAGS